MLPISYKEIEEFFLVFIRVSAILVMLPFFNARVIPVLAKTGLAVVITLSIFPVIDSGNTEFPDTVWKFMLVIGAEVIIGMIIGLVVHLFLEGVKIMGQLIGFQTGFAISNVLDPQSGAQVSILSNMAYLMAVVLFLVFNGHHILLSAVKESFEIVQVGSLNVDGEIVQRVVRQGSEMFKLAIKIGAPAIAALLFTNVAFGLITKLIPQMNIIIVAFPVQIVIGLFFFGICLTVLLGALEGFVGELYRSLTTTMAFLKV